MMSSDKIYKVNWKGDFKILELQKNSGWEFLFQFFCGDKCYQCGRDIQGNYFNCSVTKDSDLLIDFTLHGLYPGHLYVNRHWLQRDEHGVITEEKMSNEWLPVYLTTGTTESDLIDLRGMNEMELLSREVEIIRNDSSPHVLLSEEEYNALTTKDTNTIYLIKEE